MGVATKGVAMKRWGLLVFICALLAGCSTKFIYNKLDWLAVRYLEDFVELNDEQESVVRSKVKDLMEWQIDSEMPRYIKQLDELIALNPRTFSIEELKYQQQKMETYSDRLLLKIEPEIVELAKQLTDEQVEELMNSIRVRHTRYKKKYQDLPPNEMQSIYAEKIAENFEEWFGSLTPEQEAMVVEWSEHILVTQPDWIKHQTKMRIVINDLLNKRQDSSYFSQHLDRLLFDPTSYFSEALTMKREYNQGVSSRYFVKMVNSATPKQIQHYRNELEDWRYMALSLL